MGRPAPLPSVEHLARQLLLDLISAYSPAGRETANLPVLLPWLEQSGAQVVLHEPEPGRVNVLARWGAPQVLFSTHLDVVPEELPVREENGIFHGRGACDAKGQAVAQLLAIEKLLADGQDGLAWLGVCGEETDSLGAWEAFKWQSHFTQCKALINGEPTECRCGTGQRGIQHLRLCCKGVAAHSGSPELGVSANVALVNWLTALQQYVCPVDPDLGPEVWNLALLQGGTAPNVIPAHAQAEVLARTVPGTHFLDHVKALTPSNAAIECLLEEPWDHYPAIPGFTMAPMPFGSDAPQLRHLIPDKTVVLAGPGTIRVAHTDHEHLRMTDLLDGIALNCKLALHFLEKKVLADQGSAAHVR